MIKLAAALLYDKACRISGLFTFYVYVLYHYIFSGSW